MNEWRRTTSCGRRRTDLRVDWGEPWSTADHGPRPVLGHPCGSVFPEARALQYSLERRRAYLPCSGWVREEPRRCGRLNADARNRTAAYQGPLSVYGTCDPVNAWTRSWVTVQYEWWLRSVSACGLNTSLPRCVHPKSIELVFYERSQRCLFSMWVSSLDAFSSYPLSRSCPARAFSDNRYTSGDHS